MKLSRFWLLALLSVPALVATSTPAIAEADSAHVTGKVELGASFADTKDNPARVNEYATYRSDDGLSAAPSLNLEYLSKEFKLAIDANIKGPRDQKAGIEADFSRVFRLDMEYQAMEHWLDHDTLEHLGASMRGDTGGNQPVVTTDRTYAELNALLGTYPPVAGFKPAGYDPTVAYFNELSNDYLITRREWKNEAELTVPQLPNVTFHAGVRVETREGLKQAITMSKCTNCHVHADGKTVDERTEDISLGATGKFGMLTVDYEYLARDFDASGALPEYSYGTSTNNRAPALVVDGDQLLYEGLQSYSATPDSEKDSHALKARLDLSRNSMLSASYVKADIESDKAGEPGTYTLDRSSLSSEFESFFLKGATRIGDLRLTMRGGTYEIDGPDYHVTFPDRDDMLIADGGSSTYENQDFDNPEHFESAESREVKEFGIDGIYRLARGTTLRLGYEYEEVDRDEEALGETETNTFKVALKSRLNKQLSGQISYQYQDIDEPFHGEDRTGIAQGIGTTDPLYPGLAWLDTADYRYDSPNPASGAVYYWNSIYPNRTLDATNRPDEVQEGKLSATWTPSPNLAATVFARVRTEENDDVGYDQDTYVPGISLYYAPSDKINLTMAYTFNKQDTENRACVGWYHG